MKVYLYNEQSIFCGTGEAFEINGELILPPNATTVSPPAHQAGKYAQWNGTQWNLIDAEPPYFSNEQLKEFRRRAYIAESDPVFFKEQAGEVEAGTWAATRTAIRDRFPYHEEPAE